MKKRLSLMPILMAVMMVFTMMPALGETVYAGNSAKGAGQGVYLDLKYEGSGGAYASTYTGTEGTVVSINAYSTDGYRFKNWEIVSGTGSIGDKDNANTTFTMGTTDATVKAVFEILPAGGNSLVCVVYSGGTASATANPNDSAAYTLQATPASGYQFEHWNIIQGSGNITGVKNESTTITDCSGSVVVEAMFSTITYPITTNANPGEGGSAERLPYYGGPAQNVNLTATPNAGYVLKEWKITSGVGTIRNPKDANTVLENITDAVTCEAVFEAVPASMHGVHLTKNYNYGGEVKASASYGEPGTEVTLTATPASGYVFNRWEVERGGVTIDSPNSAVTTFKIGSEDVTVKAVFIPDAHYYNITTQAYGCGSGMTYNDQSESGHLVQLDASPASGWSFDHWEVVSGGVTIDNEYARKASFVMRDQDVVVRAVFVPEQTNLLREIKVTNPPKKDTYTAGESFDPDGMVVTAYYQDGSADVSGYTYEPSGALAETDTLITIRYTINGVTKETTLPITVSPRPAPAKYIVSVNASPSNGGKVTGGGTYADGDDVTVKASANTGYTFKHWTENGSVVSSNATYEFKATAARNLVAIFEATQTSKPTPAKVSGTPLAKVTANGKTGLTISWNKIQGVAGYDIFFARCNHDNKKIVTKNVKTIKGNKTFKWTKSGLKKGTAYKAYVRAYVYKNGKKKYVRNSPLMHAYTGNGTKNYTNAKSVTVNKTKVTLKKGKTFKIKAKVNKISKKKKLMPKSHAPTLRYMTSNKKVATVNSSGKITAKGKGTCVIYVYAHNGVSRSIKVVVK